MIGQDEGAAQTNAAGVERVAPGPAPKGSAVASCNLPLKRGAANWRHKPVGSVLVRLLRRRPCVTIKVREDGHEGRRWRYLSVVVWERAHGSVPAGQCLWFVNRNPLDCRLENLELIPLAERLRRNIRDNLETCRAAWAAQARVIGPKYWRAAVDAHRLAAHRRRVARERVDRVRESDRNCA
jgi:hypothetical protein